MEMCVWTLLYNPSCDVHIGGVHSNRMPKRLTDCSPLTWARLRKTPRRDGGHFLTTPTAHEGKPCEMWGFPFHSLSRLLCPARINKAGVPPETGFCPLHGVCQTHTEGGEMPGPDPGRETGLQSRFSDAWHRERQHNAHYLSSI